MKCVICKQGEIGVGKATISLQRQWVTLVIQGVPARVCRNCGEEYPEEAWRLVAIRSPTAGPA